MAERVDPAARIGGGTIGRGKDHTRRADGRADRAGARDPHADRTGRLIARAGNDRRAGGQAGERGGLAGHPRGNRRRLEHRGQQAFVDAHGVQHLARPAPMRHVEHQRARRVRDIDRVFAAQLKADVVLRQQHVAHAAPDVRLVAADPQQFRQREIGERGIRRQLEQPIAADGVVQPPALGLGALVAPDDRRPQDRAARVEQHRAVHLSGETDARDGIGRDAGLRQDRAQRILRRAPPVGGILLGPRRTRRGKRRVLRRRRAQERAVFSKQQRARAAGADINTQNRNTASRSGF